MLSSTNAVEFCRALVVLVGLTVWGCLYLNARRACRLPRNSKRLFIQMSLMFGAAAGFILQINLMSRLAPADARGGRFFSFVLIECGGGVVLTFCTLLREKRHKISLVSSDLPGSAP